MLVLDRINGIAYVALSERADRGLAERWVAEMGYRYDCMRRGQCCTPLLCRVQDSCARVALDIMAWKRRPLPWVNERIAICSSRAKSRCATS